MTRIIVAIVVFVGVLAVLALGVAVAGDEIRRDDEDARRDRWR